MICLMINKKLILGKEISLSFEKMRNIFKKFNYF